MTLTSDRKQTLVRLVDPIAGAVHRLPSRLGLAPRPARSLLDNPSAVRRVLLVRLDNIGDCLLTEPAIDAVARHFAAAEVHLLASPPGAAILANHPRIHQVHCWDAPWHRAWRGGRHGWPAALRSLRPVVRQLRRERFDLAVEFRGDIRDIESVALLGARLTVAGPTRGGGPIVDIAVPIDRAAHRVLQPLQIAAAVGADDSPRAPRVYPTAADRARAGTLVDPGGPVVALHLGSGFASKCLPVPTFAAIVRQVVQQRGDVRFLVVGGNEDRPLAAQVQALVAAPLLDLTGQLTLLQTAAVLERCQAFVGNDAGVMHIAAAAGLPVVAFFGPSNPDHYGPWGEGHAVFRTDLGCSPCDHIHCVQPIRFVCMQRFGAAAPARALLERLPAPAAAAR